MRPQKAGKEHSDSSLCVIPHQPFGDAAGLITAFALDRDGPSQLPALRDIFERLQGDARANLRSGWNRRWEADFVQPVIDAHPDRQFDFDRLRHQLAEQRQCQKPMRDCGSVWRFGLRPFDIDVNPLVVSRASLTVGGKFWRMIDRICREDLQDKSRQFVVILKRSFK
jgi:hypothetical protein